MAKMWIMRASNLPLEALLIVGCSTLGESPPRNEAPDIDATVQALVAEARPTETGVGSGAGVGVGTAVSTPTPTPTPTPPLDTGVTVQRFGGDLRIVSQGSIGTLDPVFSLFYAVSAVATQIYEGSARLGRQLRVTAPVGRVVHDEL